MDVTPDPILESIHGIQRKSDSNSAIPWSQTTGGKAHNCAVNGGHPKYNTEDFLLNTQP